MSSQSFDDKPIVNLGNVASFIAIFVGCAMTLFSVMQLIGLVSGDRGSNATATATGTISRVRIKSRNNVITCQVNYSFMVGNKEYTNPDTTGEDNTAYNDANCSKAQGQTISVEYDTENPTNNHPAPELSTGGFVASVAMLPVSLLLIGIGVYSHKLIKRAHRNREQDISQLAEANIISQTSSNLRYK